MPKLTDPERDAFLSEPGVILHLATLHEGAPAVIPIWFIYEEGAIWFTPRAPEILFCSSPRQPS